MKTIYIDITSLMSVDFLTGIQRVVRNVVVNMLAAKKNELVLLCLKGTSKKFEIIDNNKFVSYFDTNEISDKNELYTNQLLTVNDLKRNSVFYEIDSVWFSKFKRKKLYQLLKIRDIKIVNFMHDILPILNPQFFSNTGSLSSFVQYFGAAIKYSDLFITSTKSTLNEIYKLTDSMNLERIPGDYSWLGSNIKAASSSSDIDPEVVNAVEKGKYILCVGTIEPRKNLEFVLDAFEKQLFDKGINLIFAGRIGWNVGGFVERINNCSRKNSQFWHFIGLDDANIDYLYKNCTALVFSSFDEGFGLPVVESLEKGTPVIASDIPVLREVGRDYADYFELGNYDDFYDIVTKYYFDDNYRNSKIDKIKQFVSYTWQQTADRMLEIINSDIYVEDANRADETQLSQMVYLTARSEAIGDTLKYVDAFMPFIKKVLLCCPDSVRDNMLNCYSGRLEVNVLTDSQIMGGETIPKDHQLRNTLLRIKSFGLDLVDDVFLMSDDDYRPLKNIDVTTYINDGKYNAYYFYDLTMWKGDNNNYTSYDKGIFRTRDYLLKNGYPTKQYSSHMPQIINKNIYLEMVDSFPGIEKEGLDEWTIYFNYLTCNYPQLVDNKLFMTVNWPEQVDDWDLMEYPKEYLFENYYSNLYDEGQIFEGFSKQFNENTIAENKKKVDIIKSLYSKKYKADEIYKNYEKEYIKQYKEIPSFVIYAYKKELNIKLPEYMIVETNLTKKIYFNIESLDKTHLKRIDIRYVCAPIETPQEIVDTLNWFEKSVDVLNGGISFNMPGQSEKGKYSFHIQAKAKGFKEAYKIMLVEYV